jgi:hypothetical protein
MVEIMACLKSLGAGPWWVRGDQKGEERQHLSNAEGKWQAATCGQPWRVCNASSSTYTYSTSPRHDSRHSTPKPTEMTRERQISVIEQKRLTANSLPDHQPSHCLIAANSPSAGNAPSIEAID